MKLVLLAGGLGTRFAEETSLKPKPMISIGGMPILWHIMKYYSSFGINEFVILGGYKCYAIKDFFQDYYINSSDVQFNLGDNTVEILSNRSEPWKVTVVDTGLDTLTGGRLKRVSHLFKKNENFFMTYGDGLSDIDLNKLLELHVSSGKIATVSAVLPPARFGAIDINDHGNVTEFMEKPRTEEAWINGGFFVLTSDIFKYIDGDTSSFEAEPLERLVSDAQLQAYKHRGFWQPMDTLRDKINLERLWSQGKAPWRVW